MIDSKQLEQILEQGATTWQSELQHEVQKYPYCALLRWLSGTNDIATLSVMVPYRQQLYLYLHKDESNFKPITQEVQTLVVEKDTNISHNIADDAASILQQRLKELNATVERPNVDVLEEVEEVLESTMSLDELIERYNAMPPPHPMKDEDEYYYDDSRYKDYGKSSLQEKTNIVSETLAQLYENQGAYDKALKIYEVLCKNNPEKNATFAGRIEEIKVKKNKIK